jgi:hypothetical protein
MKAGVFRCKKLVETFLGFSKLKSENFESKISLQECYEQATDLIRFRLIENNLVIQSDYVKSASFINEKSPDLGTSVKTLVFFLKDKLNS